MKNLNFIFIVFVLILVLPVFSFGYHIDGHVGIVPDCDPAGTPEAQKLNNCDKWSNVLQLISNVISFILFKMVLPISAIMFAYAGWLMISAGGEAGQITQAKEIFGNIVLGLVIALAAWLIVKQILFILGYQGAWLGF